MKELNFLVLFSFPIFMFAQAELSNKLERYMQAQVDVNKFSGTVLVTRNDTVLIKKAYGFADYEWDVRNTIDSKFSLASVSKQFTAAAILQLTDNKKLALDGKLSDFFPEFPDGNRITIHQLLCHMSGLQMDFDELYLEDASITQESALKHIEQKKLLFSPGSGVAYSNIGYYLLARIIEMVSKKSYSDYLKINIFEKAKMKNSGVITNNQIIPKRAKNYMISNNGYEQNPYINWNFNIGHDGIYSTVEDLALWDKALYGTSILSAETKKLMFTSYNEQNFGYGFLINPFHNHGHQLIGHDGGFLGAMTSLNRYTDDKIFVVVLSNNQSQSHLISYGLSGITFQKEVEVPYKHIQIQSDSKNYDKFVGKYGEIEILKVNNKLYLNNVQIQLLPESKTKFFRADNNDKTIEFIKDNLGHYNSLIQTKGGGVKETIKRNLNSYETM